MKGRAREIVVRALLLKWKQTRKGAAPPGWWEGGGRGNQVSVCTFFYSTLLSASLARVVLL